MAALLGVSGAGLSWLTVRAAAQEGPLPPGPHVELVYAKCQTCHNLKYVTDSKGLPPFLWEDTVELMVQLGMQVTEEEKAQLIEYLSTYMGPNPPPEGAEAASGEGASDGESSEAVTAQAEDVDGEALYSSNCSSCHGQNGQGVPGAFPPLAGHAPALYAAEGGRAYLAQVLLYGLQGEITVAGERYDGVMPAWGHLGDAELAAILNHILTAWGNDAHLPEDFTPYEASEVAEARGLGLSAQEVHAKRPTPGDE